MKIYKFYKEDCPPCYALGRLLYQITIPTNIEIINMNVKQDDNKSLAKSHGIEKVPALLKEDGSILSGSISKEALLTFIGAEQ